MQLVGNLYLDRTDISLSRKFNEMALAWQLERKYSKSEILDMYLNTIYFGSNAYGIEAAARTYFDKDPADLTLTEAALLAGLPQAPSAYSPRRHPDKAARAPQHGAPQDERAGLHHQLRGQERARHSDRTGALLALHQDVQEPYIVAYVRKQLIDMFGEDKVFKGGLRVETTINPAYQQLALDVHHHHPQREGRSLGRAGQHRAQHRLHQGHGGQQRLRQLQVQPGRSGTPAARLGLQDLLPGRRHRDGHGSLQHLLRVHAAHHHHPGIHKSPGKSGTYGDSYYGSSTVAQATLRSDNTVYAQMAMDVGAERIVDVAHRMGITSELNADPAIALGGLTYGVSALEMASAYATLANGGSPRRADDHPQGHRLDRQR